MQTTNVSTSSALVLSVISTKGGVGKTTTAGNLGALIADTGKKVLLIDLDTQPTLSSFFPLTYEAPKGTYELLGLNETNAEQLISKTDIPNLDLIISNDNKNSLNKMLESACDGRLRLVNLLCVINFDYDLIIIDTQGAVSASLEMAILASDICISPTPPEMLPAREFGRGTINVLSGLIKGYSHWGIQVPVVNLFINRADFTSSDSMMIAESLRSNFADNELVKVLDTVIPSIASYRKASTVGVPAHRFETKRPYSRKAPAALETLKELAIEIFPQWKEELNKLTPETVKSVTQADDIEED